MFKKVSVITAIPAYTKYLYYLTHTYETVYPFQHIQSDLPISQERKCTIMNKPLVLPPITHSKSILENLSLLKKGDVIYIREPDPNNILYKIPVTEILSNGDIYVNTFGIFSKEDWYGNFSFYIEITTPEIEAEYIEQRGE